MTPTKTIKYLCLCSLIAISSCIGKFEEYNTHPTDPNPDDMTIAEKVAVLFPGMLYMMHNVQENDNQMIEQMVGAQYGGYMSTTNAWNNKNFGTFNPTADWIEIPFVRTFPGFYTNYLQVKRITESKGYIFALANIIRVAVMLRITDTYGPIPYSKVGDVQLAVEYDPVRDVYHHMINDLNNSIAELKTLSKEPRVRINPVADFDLVYNGDFTKWIRFANSLKLRIAVRIGLVDPDYAIEVIDSAFDGDLILSNEDNAFLPTIDNPYYKSAFSWQDVAVSATISAYLNGWNDPRRPVYMTMTPGRTYKGVRMGIENIDKDIYGSIAFSKPNFKSNSPLLVYCAAETYFLLAEAALRGWINGNAKDLYEQGIWTSMEQHEVSIGNYLSVTANPEYYQDPNNTLLSFDLSSPLAGGDVTVSWDRAETFAAKLEAIITQKWIANYPRMMPAAANLSSPATGGVVNNPDVLVIDPDSPDPSFAIRMARRLPFPVSEYSMNPNMQNAVNHLMGGKDEFSTDLWWVKNK